MELYTHAHNTKMDLEIPWMPSYLAESGTRNLKNIQQMPKPIPLTHDSKSKALEVG
jgi:hypothetical protein